MGILNIFKKPEEDEKATEKKTVGNKKVADSKKAAMPGKKEKSVKPEVVKGEIATPAKSVKAHKKDTAQAAMVLIKPVVTEKAADLGALNKYVFEIATHLNKKEVKKAIWSVYGVLPISVNIIRVSGKFVRYGRASGKTKNWKKAIVTLKAGDKIEIYHGV